MKPGAIGPAPISYRRLILRKSDQSVAVITRTITTIELDESDIRHYLAMKSMLPPDAKDLKIRVQVPGNAKPGDMIDIDSDYPITVRFTVERDNPNAEKVV